MQVENNPFNDRITRIVEASTKKLIVSVVTLAGGGTDTKHVVLSDGSQIVVKISKNPSDDLAVEGATMDFLRNHTQLPVPVLFYSDKDILVHEYVVADGSLNMASEPEAAGHLAKLHDISSDCFGFDFDTLRSGVQQPNQKFSKWVPFFVQNRVLYMARKAFECGRLPLELMQRIDNFCQKMESYLDEPPKPALLHGDISVTSILCHHGKVKAFVDPAVFFGDPEFEFVFATPHLSLSKVFFDVYNELHPFRPGFFEYRQTIYSLYPLLLYIKLFGAFYIPRVIDVLTRFGF